MVLGIMLQLLDKLDLSGLAMFEFVREARRGGNKVTKVRIKGVISESNENVRTQAWGGPFMRIIPDGDGRGVRFERVKVMHPSSGFGKLVSKNIGNSRIWVVSNALASSTSKAISDGVMKEIEGVQVLAGSSMKTEGIPSLLACAGRRREQGHHNMPSEGIREGIVVKRIQDEARDKARIKRKRHGRGQWSKKVGGDSWVSAHRGSLINVHDIKLFS
jgi:hypothetical protein